MSYFAHEFEGVVQHHNVGTYVYTVVFLDPAIAAQLPFDQSPRLRMRGEINDHPIEAAWQPVKGRYYVMLSKSLLKAAELAVGDRATVRFSLVDQNAVDVPADIQHIIDNNTKFGENWQNLSAGKQRGFMHWIGEAKTTQTRSKRIAQLIDGLNQNPNIGPMELVRAIKEQKTVTEKPSR
jgi:Bacteriocin-protection, YdeI or OmpD-Associated/Domain of unknown function (DUF1905)